ncbi:discoidin domain-containing protein [Bacteroides thetaiotaomicron]|uniref:DUF4998 domain-containing protein n=1 Tax=Bacteroides thetaiotaomicron TaxID=818 RepID=UPI0006D59937|nr:DUF4998 domain-containing protein [Bacteroides thetaiotaomicron]MCA6027405.1 discoidin domain-containing protein [Bacteroides thetaiotaomicron]
MKNTIKYLACSLTAFLMTACGDMYDIHEKYLEMGEETYLGAVQDLNAYSGFNRIKLEWYLNADPRISSCVITWEGGENPVEVPVQENRVVKDPMSTIINLPEGKYIFNMITRSDTGKESLVRTIAGEVYGSNYQAGLSAQGINSMSANLTGVTINWTSAERCIETKLTYTNNEGIEKTVTQPEGEMTLILPDAVLNTQFKLVSRYSLPDNAIDDVQTTEKVMNFPAYYTVSKEEWNEIHNQYIDVDRTGWGVEANTEELTGEGAVNGHKEALIDGDLNTFWHSQWDGEGKNPPLPHIITFDMQQTQNILSIELARRKDNLDLKAVMFSISDDKENWTELGKLDFPNDKVPNAQIILLPKAVSGRYFRTTVTDSNNGVNASIAEIMFTMGKK